MPISWNTSLTSAPVAFAQGFDATVDLGTDGTYFVDPLNGDDLAAGSLAAPFATVGKALTEIGDGGTGKIRVRNTAKIRESITMLNGQDADNRIEILGYGTEKPIWTNGNLVTGWTQCTIADEPVVGANWASIYKVTVANSSFVSGDPIEANIFENDVQLEIVVDWEGLNLGDKFFIQNVNDHFSADSPPALDGSNNILSYDSTAVTTAYTVDQLLNSVLIGHKTGNAAFSSDIASVSGTTIVLADQTNVYGTNPDKRDRFALVNILPAMAQGNWGYVDNGDTTSTLYIWPNDTANLTSGIEVCARATCITATNRSFWNVKGIQFQQAARADGSSIVGWIFQSATAFSSHSDVEHCRFYGASFARPSAVNKSPVRFQFHSNLKFQFNTIENVQGGWGMFCFGQGQSSPNEATTVFGLNNVIRRNIIKRTSRTPMWFAGQRLLVVAHNRMEETGFAAHGNKGNLYQQTQDALVFGNVYVNTDGYFGWQTASGLHFLFNHIPATREATSTSSRALVDQQSSTLPPSEWNPAFDGECLILNNTFWPQPVGYDGTATNGVAFGSVHATVTGVMKNNIYHGINVTSARVTTSSNNWNTASDGAYTVDDVAMSGAANYTAPSAGDFTILPAAPIRSEVGDSIATEIAALQSTFGALFSDWTLDALGNMITHSAPRIGAVVNHDYSTIKGTDQYKIFTA